VDQRPASEGKKMLDESGKIEVKIGRVQPSERRMQLNGSAVVSLLWFFCYVGVFPRYTQIAEEWQGQKLAVGSVA
jgi:hypothetical protein